MHIQHEDMPSNTGPPVERCAILTADFFLYVRNISITHSETQQAEVSHLRTCITHKLLYSFSSKMCHLSRIQLLKKGLDIDARYIQIARSDTQQAQVSFVHTHITHTLLCSSSLKIILCHLC